MNYLSLLSNTQAYRTFIKERDEGTLSHAYLVVSPDADMNRAYIKYFAKALFCENQTVCNACRACELIESERYGDCTVYPAEKEGEKTQKIVTADIDDLVRQSYLKPVEGARLVFVLAGAENLTEQAQNKLLKTLEEPPQGVVILMIATSEYAMLSTVRSRVKKLELPYFTPEQITEALRDEVEDEDRLRLAAVSAGGTIGKALKLARDNSFLDMVGLSLQILTNMQKSSDVLSFSTLVMKYKTSLPAFLDVLEIVARDALMFKTGHKNMVMNKSRVVEIAKAGFTFAPAALIGIIERCGEAKQSLKYNANTQMVVDTLLFGILEGKYQWRKS